MDLMNYKTILAIDPSGNFEEGKGTTGTCLFDCTTNHIINLKNIQAKDYPTKEEYWQAHLNMIRTASKQRPDIVIVMEDFTLDPRRAMQQSHSKMETPKLIGIIQLYCQQNNIKYAMQRAVDVKTRWADHILEYKKYIFKKNRMYYIAESTTPMSRHCKDAIRHAVHYATFYNKEEQNGN